MWLWWLVGLGALLLFVWAVARTAGSSGSRGSEESPEAVLKRRYARGEMDDQEYERRLGNLRK
jgi:putative membrane protein